jgi:hypothetical protein
MAAETKRRKGVPVFFEEHPWLLIAVVIGIVEAWGLTKAVVRQQLQRLREHPATVRRRPR